MSATIGVIGAGSFGTALATAFARCGKDVLLWGRDPQLIETLNASHRNEKYAAGVALPENLRGTTSLAELCKESSVWVYACPSHSLRDFLKQMAGFLQERADTPWIVNTAKGIDAAELKLHHQIAEEILGRAFVRESFLCLSGPSFASEILREVPTCVTLSGFDWRRVGDAQKMLSTPVLRFYSNTDIVGCQLGGAMKNVIAISAGIIEGMGLGYNTQAALINLGLGEIARLGALMGAKTETFLGLSGMGDLILTATSPLSRNRRFGMQLGAGKSLEEAKAAVGSTIEGIAAAQAVQALAARYSVRTPICRQVYEILHGQKPVRAALDDLLATEAGGEWL